MMQLLSALRLEVPPMMQVLSALRLEGAPVKHLIATRARTPRRKMHVVRRVSPFGDCFVLAIG